MQRHLCDLATEHRLEQVLLLLANQSCVACPYLELMRSRYSRAPMKTSHIHQRYSYRHRQLEDSYNLQFHA